MSVGAVILAGGRGTRISHLLPGIPKPMAPVGGRPFLEWVVLFLAGAGIADIVISSGHLGEVIEGHFAGRSIAGARVSCRREAGTLGTAGGFLHAIEGRDRAHERWLVANGDSLVLTDLSAFLRWGAEREANAHLLGVQMDDAARFGTLVASSDGSLESFREKRPGAGLINAGTYLFPASAIADFPAGRPLSFEMQVFPNWLAWGRSLRVLPVRAPFIDIGTPESLPLAAEFIDSHRRFFPESAE